MSEHRDAEDLELDVFRQSERIRDYVFPLGTVAENSSGALEFRFLGTGFLLGSRGYALTAAHVIRDHRASHVVALFLDQRNEWRRFSVRAHCLHDQEDVALLKLDGGPWRSFFRLSNTFENASRNYQMFGYPEDVATELVNQGHFQYRPDLIYAQGYIRRRLSFEIPVLRGTQFFEVSEVVGPGCSGSPIYVLRGGVLDVIGMYAGELLTERGTSRAFAVRVEAFRDWQPPIIDRTILLESRADTPDV